MSNKNKNNNCHRSERYLREEESAGKNVGNNVHNNKNAHNNNAENNYSDKKCWNKNCKCNGGQTKSCK